MAHELLDFGNGQMKAQNENDIPLRKGKLKRPGSAARKRSRKRYREKRAKTTLYRERTELRNERDHLRVERDDARVQCDTLCAERDNLRVERDHLHAERDELHAKFEELNKRLQDLQSWAARLQQHLLNNVSAYQQLWGERDDTTESYIERSMAKLIVMLDTNHSTQRRLEELLSESRKENADLNDQIDLLVASLDTAKRLLVELAPGLHDYKIKQFVTDVKHADEVQQQAWCDERVARKCDGYKQIKPGTVCLLDDRFALAHLSKESCLSENDLKSLLDLLKQVHNVMQRLKRSKIKERGTSVGMGQTKKYEKGRPFKSYLLKMGKVRKQRGDTLEQAFPHLAKEAARHARKLEDILAAIFPLAVLERRNLAARSKVPVFTDTGTTVMFDTCNYTTAAHRDHDIGSCKAIAVFLEEHEKQCTREQCARRWRFFCPELRRYVKVRHGTIIVWDSESVLHGTTVHSVPHSSCCNSTRWAIVSQLKTKHYK